MARFGEGYHFYATGLTHNEQGFPDMTEITQHRLVTRLCDKIRKNVDEIARVEKTRLDDADVGIVTYGSPSRSAKKTVEMARKENIKTGLLRLITLWPFPEKQIKELSETVKIIVVAEMNYGQIVREIERAACNTPVLFLPKLGGEIHTPKDILAGVRRSIK
jgi:2-oxoglutarate ferredoxin oxidoreductase subunit alpha